MDATALIDRLERFADVLPEVVGGLSPEDARWRPDENSWSILEIVTHLADEEVEDFRRRVELTLRDPDAPWPPIDPAGWAVERRYNEGSLADVLERWVAARRASVQWLRGLRDPDWAKTHQHPTLGSMRAGEVLVAWVAHDALHLRQVAKRLYQMTKRDGGEYPPDYAGSWTA